MERLKRIPLPFAGTALGLAALGNLIQNYSETVRIIFGIISALIICALILKIVTNWDTVKEEVRNPVIASSFVTFFMTPVILSSYLPGTATGRVLWYAGVIGHLLYLIWFCATFFSDFKLAKVFPSWFVPFVGMVVGSVTAPAFGLVGFGKVLFWLGFVLYFIQLVLVTYRCVKLPELPPPAVPTYAIYAAPASLLLAGYIRSFGTDGSIYPAMVYLLLCLSIVFYVFGLYISVREGGKKFMPSFSSFTFPMVISGIAVKLTNGWMVKNNIGILWMKYLVNFQEIVAVICVIGVLLLYIKALTAPPALPAGEVKK